MPSLAPTTWRLCVDFDLRQRVRTIAGWLATLALLAGCETFSDDMASLSTPFKQTTPSEAARMAVDPTDADKRREGITLLSNAPFGGVQAYVDYYRDAVTNEREPIVKAAAIRALGRHGSPADALLIMPFLASDNEQVRWASAIALQRLHNPAAVPDLLRVLANENESRDVRIAAAIALGQYPEDRVFQGLVGALNARELAVNEAAEQSLHTLTDMTFNLNAADWLAWYEQASKTNSAFADQQEYLYPTYSRKIKWYEKVAFWKPVVWEKPAPPAGLREDDIRRTYDDADAPPIPGRESPATRPTSEQPTTRRSTYGDEG